MSKIDFSTIFGKSISTKNNTSNNLSMFFDKNIFELAPEPDPYADYKQMLNSVSYITHQFFAASKLHSGSSDTNMITPISVISGSFVMNRLKQVGVYNEFDYAEYADAIEHLFDIDNVVIVNDKATDGGTYFIILELDNPYMKIDTDKNYVKGMYYTIGGHLIPQDNDRLNLLFERDILRQYNEYLAARVDYSLLDVFTQSYMREHGIQDESELTIDDYINILDEDEQFIESDDLYLRFIETSWNEEEMDIVKLKEYYETRKSTVSTNKMIQYPEFDDLYFPYMLPITTYYDDRYSTYQTALFAVNDLLDFFDKLKQHNIPGIDPSVKTFGARLKEQMEQYHINKNTSFIISPSLDGLRNSIYHNDYGIPSIVMILVDLMNPECKTNTKISSISDEESSDDLSPTLFFNVFAVDFEPYADWTGGTATWYPWADVEILEESSASHPFATDIHIKELIKDIEIKDILK